MSSISGNQELKAELINRWLQLDVYSTAGTQQRHKEIVDDAADRAPWMKITSDRLSKWLNGESKFLSDKQVLWLATRYGIDVDTYIGMPVVKKGEITFEVQPYNELECLRKVKKKFPKP